MKIEAVIFIIVAVAIASSIYGLLKHFFVRRNEFVSSYSGNSKVIPWSYFEKESRWISPENPLTPSRMNGNIYLGEDEMDTNWENFNKKD